MRIAVNTRFLLSKYLEGYGYFIAEVFRRVTARHPEHEFIFIFDRPYDQKFVFSANVTPVIAGPAARHPVLWKYWYDVSVPAVLKKYRADIFVSCDGFCSLTTKLPQCLLIHDLSFLHHPSLIPKSHLFFYKRYTPKFLEKAESIVTVSEFSKQDIARHYPVPAEKISVVPNAARPVFRRYESHEKEATRRQYTGGTEYFVYAGAIHPRKNLFNLLKAFSIFKRRQKSGWKLVLAGRLAWMYSQFTTSLRTYKYRNDVLLTGYLPEEELARVIGSAYAMVYPSLWEGFGVPVLEAMQSGVPVVTSVNSAMQEIAGDAALYANVSDHQDLAEKMMLLYKDEKLRQAMIDRGVQVAGQYRWEDSADLFWDAILKASSPSFAARP